MENKTNTIIIVVVLALAVIAIGYYGVTGGPGYSKWKITKQECKSEGVDPYCIMSKCEKL